MSAYPDDGQLTIDTGKQKVSGWQAIRLTRGIERCPSDFDLALTEHFPGEARDLQIHAGDVCRVRIGSDPVLTGYVDRVQPSITAGTHEVRIMGRSACTDIVDSSVHYRGGVFNGQSIRQIAESLFAPFGVKVVALAGEGLTIPQLVINLGETPYQVVERLMRYNAMLGYDNVEGNFVLARVGTESMGSGIVEGQNVLDVAGEFDLSQRYTTYHAYMMSTDSLQDAKPIQDGNLRATVTDDGMTPLVRPDGQPRIRELAIISEQTDQVGLVAARRALWEMKRRYGRSMAVRVTVDSWRDAAGKLWEPNYRVKLNIPHCKIVGLEWVIGEVTYIRDGEGTRCSMVIMPPEAFSPEPTALNLFDNQIRQELDQGQTITDPTISKPSSDFGQG